MAYLNKIDINGRTYYLQHLTDGKYEAKLPELEKDSTLIVQDYSSYGGNVGDSNTPVYIEKNKVKPFSSTIGGGTQFVYMSAGNIMPSTSTVGSDIKPIYMEDGIMTESSVTVGSGTQPIYLDSGEITVSDSTVGSGIMPIYMKDGTITASDETVGANVKPVYMYNGEITESDADVGSGIKPVYMSGGTITASKSIVGATNKPVYMKDGEITECSGNIGSSSVPVYMSNGAILACGTIPISSGGTGATTASGALENLGLTATAAELNTLDGITATVTELNYVDGVTSNIQDQFSNHEGRIATMETFFKAADFDNGSNSFIDTLKEIQDYISDDETGAAEMLKSIGNNTAAINTLNGDSKTAGSVAKAVADAVAKEAETARAAEKANADAIIKLNGDASTAGSVLSTVNSAVSGVVGNAKTYTTLGSIEAWINSNPGGGSGGSVTTTAQYFDNVAALKAASVNAGSICITRGYSSADDGGGAMYVITDSKTYSDKRSFKLTSGKYANIFNTNNILCYGGDNKGSAANDTVLTNMRKFTDSIYFPGGVYKFSSPITCNINSDSNDKIGRAHV